MKNYLLRKFRAIICYWMNITDNWVVPVTLLDGIYDATITLEYAQKLLDVQTELWGADDPEIESTQHFLNLIRE